MNKTLVIMAHDDIENSVLNKHFKNELQNQENIIYKDISSLYPDNNIDIEKEQEDIKKASKIVFQFPMYWYNVPSALKNWMDKVFSYDFAYIIDEEGAFQAQALKGKDFQIVATIGAHQESYEGEDRLSVKDCLNSCFYTAKMLGMKELESIFIYGAAYDKISPELLTSYSQRIKKELLG